MLPKGLQNYTNLLHNFIQYIKTYDLVEDGFPDLGILQFDRKLYFVI